VIQVTAQTLGLRYPSILSFRVNYVGEPAGQLPTGLWDELQRIGCSRTYSTGSPLFMEEAPADGVYLIEKGAIEIQLSSPLSEHLSEDGRGALLGLSEVMSGETHKFKAVAIEDCVVCFVARHEFLEFLRQNQVCCMQVVHLLSQDLHTIYQHLQSEPRAVGRGRKGKHGSSPAPSRKAI
jgi:CRP-like cAMP-binding protein